MIDKDLLKQSLTLNEVFKLVESLGGKPTYSKEGFISDTICHNFPNEGSHKLYYYEDGKNFHCYTGDCGSFDIYELVRKVFNIQKHQIIEFTACVYYVMEQTGHRDLAFSQDVVSSTIKTPEADELIQFLDRIESWRSSEKVVLKEYSDELIKNLPCYHIEGWEQEGITYDSLKKYEIRYYAPTNKIVIPHRDIDGRLIGIRGRALDPEEVKISGKYMPLYVGEGKNYAHPLGYNLYGLDKNKDNIKSLHKVIVFEGEKSVMLAENSFKNNFSVAVCGSNLTNYQLDLLLDLGVEEIIIAFDRQYKEYCDKEYQEWKKKLIKIQDKIRHYANVTFVLDKKHLLKYKDAPVDEGTEIFKKLLAERTMI